MATKRITIALVSGWAMLSMLGCAESRNRVWVESTQTLTISNADLSALAIQTHNGHISVTGDDAATEPEVVVSLKAGGWTLEGAEACEAAIEIVSEPTDDSGHRLAWRSAEPQKREWNASVSFDIVLPTDVAIAAETHNGRVTCERLAADCRAVSYNGAIRVESREGTVDVETHNGRLDIACVGDHVNLVTHNGSVKLDASQCAKLGGHVETHNGNVEVRLGPDTATNLSCATHNGRIKCRAKLDSAEIARNRARGSLGGGGDTLQVETHNGSIHIN